MGYAKTLISACLIVLVAMALLGAGGASASQPKAELQGGELFPVTFTGSGGEGTLETITVGGVVRTVTCTASTSSGEISSGTTAKNIKVSLTGCTLTAPVGSKLTCTSSKANSGEIQTVTLKGTLFYLVAGSSEVGVDLKPESGTTVATFTCGGVETLTVKEGVIGKLTPVNTLTNSFTLTFSQISGKQSPETYLSASGCAATKETLTTEGSGFENFLAIQSGIKGSETLTTAKTMKVVSTKCA